MRANPFRVRSRVYFALTSEPVTVEVFFVFGGRLVGEIDRAVDEEGKPASGDELSPVHNSETP